MSLMGAMGAPPGDMGGRMSSGVPHIPSHDVVGDLATFRAPHDDATRHNEDGEEELDEEEDEDDDEESEEEEDEDEDDA